MMTVDEEKAQFEKFMEEYVDDMLDEQEYDTIYQYGPLTDKYWSTNPRILICNLEPYDEREGHVLVDMNLFREWIKAPTGRFAAKFASVLLKALTNESKLEDLNFSRINMLDSLADIEKIAYLNFRVDSGVHSQADYRNIFTQVDAHKDYLRGYFIKLNPDIIVLGGKASCFLINRILNVHLEYNSAVMADGKIFCSVRHFSRANYKDYILRIKDILDVYQNRQNRAAN
ncbi:MAG: hypothetical protein AB7U05_01845 [Mangrovibacterium sp.]